MGMDKKNKKWKKSRDWRKYNYWRTRDSELMIRNLRDQVLLMRNPFPRKKKGEYRGKKRGRKPKDHISVIMCLLLKVMLKKSYRDIYSLLKTDNSLRKLAGITELPHYNTLNDYMKVLPTGYLDDLIKGLYMKGLEIKKREVVQEKEGQLMAQVLQPQQEHSGTAFAFARR
jgi:hypothetical protein